MNRKKFRMTQTNQELDRIIIESFKHNQFPDQQKAALKEIRMRKEELKWRPNYKLGAEDQLKRNSKPKTDGDNFSIVEIPNLV